MFEFGLHTWASNDPRGCFSSDVCRDDELSSARRSGELPINFEEEISASMNIEKNTENSQDTS